MAGATLLALHLGDLSRRERNDHVPHLTALAADRLDVFPD
jgi:hypothetical protein